MALDGISLTIARGAAPNMPTIERQTKTVAAFLATATGMAKIAKTNTPTVMGYLRPTTSEAGPKAMGPTAKPSTKSAVDRMATSAETPNSMAISDTPGLITDDAKVDMQVSMARLLAI
jgi:hypothetical protein